MDFVSQLVSQPYCWHKLGMGNLFVIITGRNNCVILLAGRKN